MNDPSELRPRLEGPRVPWGAVLKGALAAGASGGMGYAMGGVLANALQQKFPGLGIQYLSPQEQSRFFSTVLGISAAGGAVSALGREIAAGQHLQQAAEEVNEKKAMVDFAYAGVLHE